MNFLNWLRGHPIRVRDEQGTLHVSGYQWREIPLYVFFLIGTAGAASFGLFVLRFTVDGFWIASPYLLAMWLSIGLFEGLWDYVRVIEFWQHGAIKSSNGLPNRFGARQLPFDQDAIASIEVTGECEGAGVAIYTVEGETIIVGHRLRTVDARRVAVQLTKALRDMRESMATINGAQAARNPARDRRQFLRELEQEVIRQSGTASASGSSLAP
ncbi:MAG: hypothetical protein K2Y42_20245 [Hyphomicrobium sp.]|jgi:hypothetical protein|uniref:hypothetical protein n=1 Tax=Hyphomicrobium sp. TaxID=82 RepID=UPI0025C6CC03|nr:hypothetical protein [Hyphomicrobium sp.]MBX9865079.1 hypothetical protein [Hyphomicrobium sp.]